MLLGDVAIDAVRCIVDMQVEARAERGTLAIVPRQVEGCGSQILQPVGDCRPALHGVGTFQAIEGIGRGEERFLLASDKAIDQCFYAMVIDGWGRVSGTSGKPLGELERGTHARQSYARCG